MRFATPAGQTLAGLAAFACLAVAVLALEPAPAHSYASGAPAAFSGPEQYCNACHGSPASNPVNAGPGAVTIDAPDTFAPGEAVAVTVTLDPAGPPSRQGFELSARDGALAHVGAFEVDGTTVQYAQGDEDYVTHTSASNGAVSWSFTWVAPAEDAPASVTLYAAANASNGNFIPDDGDAIYAAEHVLTLEAPPAVVATMEPVNPPVVLGPGGGTIQYRVTLTNTTGQQQTVDAWTDALLPNGNVYGPVEGPQRVRLSAGQTLGPLTLRLRVPGAAPAGTYTYRLRLGQYPGTVISEDAFTFVKQAGAGLAANAPERGGAVALLGEGPFLGTAQAAAGLSPGPAGDAAGLAVSPNPFAGRTAVHFTLAEAQWVRVAAYDLLGREVAVLADGPLPAGTYQAAFEAPHLAAGTYGVRLTAGAHTATRRVTLVR